MEILHNKQQVIVQYFTKTDSKSTTLDILYSWITSVMLGKQRYCNHTCITIYKIEKK